MINATETNIAAVKADLDKFSDHTREEIAAELKLAENAESHGGKVMKKIAAQARKNVVRLQGYADGLLDARLSIMKWME